MAYTHDVRFLLTLKLAWKVSSGHCSAAISQEQHAENSQPSSVNHIARVGWLRVIVCQYVSRLCQGSRDLQAGTCECTGYALLLYMQHSDYCKLPETEAASALSFYCSTSIDTYTNFESTRNGLNLQATAHRPSWR